MSYEQLTLEERYYLAEFLEKGMSIRAIARKLKRSPSTISRELRRDRGKRGYPTGQNLQSFENWRSSSKRQCTLRNHISHGSGVATKTPTDCFDISIPGVVTFWTYHRRSLSASLT